MNPLNRRQALALAALTLGACATGETVPASNLPPGKESIPLGNPGFTPSANGKIAGWEGVEHNAGNSYTFLPDTEFLVSAPASARIRRHGVELYGLLEQRVRMQPAWLGRTARLSGYLRTRGANDEGACLVMQARDGSDSILVSELMNERRVKGDTDWKQYAVQFKVPSNAWWLRVGVMLEGGGTLWADDLALDLMD